MRRCNDATYCLNTALLGFVVVLVFVAAYCLNAALMGFVAAYCLNAALMGFVVLAVACVVVFVYARWQIGG